MLHHTTITSHQPIGALAWLGHQLVDVAQNHLLYAIGNQVQPHSQGPLPYRYGNRFTGLAQLNGTEWMVLYERLGTKGLVLHNGQLVREINRSYYHSLAYEYPATVCAGSDGQPLLAHCPEHYNRLEVETLTAGQRLTETAFRSLADVFHSRLAVSPNGRWLASAGWYWAPEDCLTLIDLHKAIPDPKYLDHEAANVIIDSAVASACWLPDNTLLLSTGEGDADMNDDGMMPHQTGIYHPDTGQFSTVWETSIPTGHWHPIDAHFAWDLLHHPKIIDLRHGTIIAQLPELNTGVVNSSIIPANAIYPVVALHANGSWLGIAIGSTLHVLHWQR